MDLRQSLHKPSIDQLSQPITQLVSTTRLVELQELIGSTPERLAKIELYMEELRAHYDLTDLMAAFAAIKIGFPEINVDRFMHAIEAEQMLQKINTWRTDSETIVETGAVFFAILFAHDSKLKSRVTIEPGVLVERALRLNEIKSQCTELVAFLLFIVLIFPAYNNQQFLDQFQQFIGDSIGKYQAQHGVMVLAFAKLLYPSDARFQNMNYYFPQALPTLEHLTMSAEELNMSTYLWFALMLNIVFAGTSIVDGNIIINPHAVTEYMKEEAPLPSNLNF